MPTRRAVLRAAVGAGATALVGAVAVIATRPRHPRWHTDIYPPDPNQVLAPNPVGVFGHGVASGDPRTSAVMLWTRVSVDGDDEVPVVVEVATDPTLEHPVLTKALVAAAADDFCVSHYVEGLQPDTAYYYRFTAAGERSPIGRARTLPVDGPVRVAFAACASYGHGRFWSYADLAQRSDLHAVVHLGDYIYDTPGYGHPGTYGTSRLVDPPQGCVTLDDYRARYSQYRADPQLAELHRQHSIIAIWDDHEFADDPRPGGATGHDPNRHGDWHARVRAATQAWYEWMPVRARSGPLWRSFQFGKTADLVVVDRFHEALHGRSNEPVAGHQERFLMERAIRSDAKWFLLGSGAGTTSRRADGRGGWPDKVRDRLLDALDGQPLISVGADSHRFEALALPGPSRSKGEFAGGGEFAAGSISSPGVPPATDGVGDHVLWSDETRRGYCVVTCDDDVAQVDFFGVDDAAVRSDDRPTERWFGGYVMDGHRRPPTKAAAPAAPLDSPAPAP